MLITSGGLKNLIDRAMVIYCRKRASIHQETVPEAKTRLTLKNSSISVELTAWEVKAMSENDIAEDSRKVYIRPLIASLFFAVAGEFLLLVIYGIILFPEGNLLYKALWTILFCGIGMGATLGAGINLFIVGRYSGTKAILSTILLTFLTMGIACDLLCLNLDLHFNYFGAQTNPVLFSAGGVLGSLIGGAGIGGLLFSETGRSILDRIGL